MDDGRAITLAKLIGKIAQGDLFGMIGQVAARVAIGRGAGTTNFASSKSEMPEEAVRRALAERGTPVCLTDDVNSQACLEEVAELKPDIVFCAAFPQIFKKPLFEIARGGVVNFHPSLLPRYRGAHPVYWVLARGETETGLTAHFMNEQIDAGDIIAQLRVSIGPEDDYDTLYQKLIAEVPELTRRVEEVLLSGTVASERQNEEQATLFRQDREIHWRIFWRLQGSKEVADRIRAGGAFAFFRGRLLLLHKARAVHSNRNLTNDVAVEPGTIVDLTDQHVVVAVAGGCLELHELTYLLGRMQARTFIRIFRPLVGETIG